MESIEGGYPCFFAIPVLVFSSSGGPNANYFAAAWKVYTCWNDY